MWWKITPHETPLEKVAALMQKQCSITSFTELRAEFNRYCFSRLCRGQWLIISHWNLCSINFLSLELYFNFLTLERRLVSDPQSNITTWFQQRGYSSPIRRVVILQLHRTVFLVHHPSASAILSLSFGCQERSGQTFQRGKFLRFICKASDFGHRRCFWQKSCPPAATSTHTNLAWGQGTRGTGAAHKAYTGAPWSHTTPNSTHCCVVPSPLCQMPLPEAQGPSSGDGAGWSQVSVITDRVSGACNIVWLLCASSTLVP